MRYFKGSTQLFNSMRSQVMELLEQPNGKTDQPWEENVTSLALAPHEYTPPEYQQLIAFALANGGEEITEAEYRALQPSDQDL